MTATGFALFASPLLAQIDSPLAQTLALLLPDLWVVFFVPLVLTLLTGGRLRTVMDRVLVAAVLLEVLVLAPLWLMFAPADGNLLLIVDDPALAGIFDTLQRVLFVAIPVGTALVLGARWSRRLDAGAARAPARASRVRPACCCSRVMLVVQLVAGVKSQVLLWIARLLADHGPDRVPRRAAALAAGAGGRRRPVPATCARSARSSCRPRWPACSATRSCCSPSRTATASSTLTGRPVSLPDSTPGGRSRRSTATASASPC